MSQPENPNPDQPDQSRFIWQEGDLIIEPPPEEPPQPPQEPVNGTDRQQQ